MGDLGGLTSQLTSSSFGRDVKLGVPCLDAACTVGLVARNSDKPSQNKLKTNKTVFQKASTCGICYNVLIRQGVTADTTVLEIEMENNIIDQEKAKMTPTVFVKICRIY